MGLHKARKRVGSKNMIRYMEVERALSLTGNPITSLALRGSHHVDNATDYKYLENYRHRQLNLKKMELVDPLVHGFIHIPNDEYAIQLAVATQPVLAEILVDETFEKLNAKAVFYNLILLL